MKIVQHIPNMVDHAGRPPEAEGTWEEVRKVEWVDRWTRMELDGCGFRRFSRADDSLMAEYGEVASAESGELLPRTYWVVGRVRDAHEQEDFMALPVWVSSPPRDEDGTVGERWR